MALKTLQTSPLGSSLVGKFRSSEVRKVNDSKELAAKEGGKSMNKLNLLPRATRSAKKEKLVKKNASKKETGVSTEPPHTVDCGSNTELSMAKLKEVVDGDQPNEVVKMLKSAVPSERYFELIAEERRKALDEALQENLQLSQEIARLREENSQLKVLAEEGLKYAEILRQVVGDEEPAN